MSITVHKVETPQQHEAFVRLPWELYKDNPYWVAELPSMRRETLSREKHPAWDYLEGDYFLATRGEQIVGQIAAFVNKRHNEYHNENIGFFGFFECIEDAEVAAALFKTAKDYLRGKGVDAIRGPASFSSNELYGLLIDNFDTIPTTLMPYNPPYYQKFLEDAGFAKAKDLHSWRAEFSYAPEMFYEEDGQTERRIVKATRRNIKRRNITVRTLDTRHKRRDFEMMRDIYHDGWETNWGFVPMTNRELDALIDTLGFLVLPRYCFFASVDGDPAGFMILIPNFNQVLHAVKPKPGVPEAWWYAKAAWHWKIRSKIDNLRVPLMGVKKQYHGLGVTPSMFLALGEQMLAEKQPLQWVEPGWVLEDNRDTNEVLKHFNCHIFRTHRIYEKSLDR